MAPAKYVYVYQIRRLSFSLSHEFELHGWLRHASKKMLSKSRMKDVIAGAVVFQDATWE